MAIGGGIVVLDFGSQFTQLIARRFRELGVYSEILPFDSSIEAIKEHGPSGIVVSGGPCSVYDPNSPKRDDLKDLLDLAPVLGICYGMQLLAYHLGGKVEASQQREYGRMSIRWTEKNSDQRVWMSHGDLVTKLPSGAQGLAKSDSGHWAAMKGSKPGRGFMGIQFHPEVSHTENGMQILKEFAFDVCQAERKWQGKFLIQHLIDEICKKVGDRDHVLCALSGGVDSTVTAALLNRALGEKRVHSVFVDTGLLRQREAEQVVQWYENIRLPVTAVHAQRQFLDALKAIEDPEEKRKTIGRVFIEVFDKATEEFPCTWLAQGTLYPDVIESVNLRGQSVTIKSHHNVGGLPKNMRLKLVEPLRELFKDEVRVLGHELGIPKLLLDRHPFPGPGLAIRIIGDVNVQDLDLLRRADHIFVEELRNADLYGKIWQAFVALLPVKSVGVMGDARTYERVAALRAVTSLDGMTADWYPFDALFLGKVSNRITNEVKGINRVVYDISSKPPATIEWE